MSEQQIGKPGHPATVSSTMIQDAVKPVYMNDLKTATVMFHIVTEQVIKTGTEITEKRINTMVIIAGKNNNWVQAVQVSSALFPAIIHAAWVNETA